MNFLNKNLVRNLILSIIAMCINLNANSQCVVSVTSSTGYTVEITFCPTQVLAPDDCPWGYNYNIEFDYDIVFSGTNIPSNLWTLQGTTTCSDGSSSFFPLPNAGGSGVGATIGNQWNPNTDCATATPTSLGCTSIEFQIHGPGIPNQILSCDATNCISALLPVPVELTGFSATVIENDVLIDWKTETEINNDYFILERSLDGQRWQEIYTIEGAGNSVSELQYNYIDKAAIDGRNFYRLTQVDYNGEKNISDIVTASIKRDSKFSAFPNPIRDVATITNASGTITIFDQLGALVVQKSLSDEVQNADIDVSMLPSGVYILRNNTEVHKLVKQ